MIVSMIELPIKTSITVNPRLKETYKDENLRFDILAFIFSSLLSLFIVIRSPAYNRV
ncbi:hypothetical protein ES703_61142 [subsurface metagenome]